jgi:26S proteasome regulatory subunit N10
MSGLEAVMICIDNSEFARDLDFAPSRLEAQTDAATVIAGAKTQAHPENVVGVAFMAGDRVDIKLNPCADIGKILSVLASTEIAESAEGCDLVRAIQTCSIALKHRQNKNQKQRLVCFVSSPASGVSEKQLETLGKVLKKNNVAIDIINVGSSGTDTSVKLRKFVETADSTGNPCHYVEVESNSGVHLADMIVSSPILGGGGAAVGEGGEELGGFDSNMDPELAMAIRLSMEEERQRQATAAAGSSGTDASSSSVRPPVQPVEEDFDAELRAALMASLQESQPVEEEMDMDEEVRKALAESMEDWDGGSEPKKAKKEDEKKKE